MSATDHLPVELLSAHLDGEATAEERARVEAHLAGCESCRATLEDLRRIVDASAQLGAPELPEGLRERIASSILPPASGRRAWLGAAASLAAAGLVATAWYLQGPEAPRPQAPSAEVRSPEAAPPPPTPPPPPLRKPKPKPKPLPEPEVIATEGAARDAEAKHAPALEPEVRERVLDSFRREETTAPRPTAKASSAREATPERDENLAARAGAGLGDEPCGVVEFVEVSSDVAIARGPLEDALRRQGARPQPESRPGILEVIVPRSLWPECRRTLAEAGVRVEETRVESLPGACIGVRVRFPAP
ncbi:MAG TPA: anti-sigma factor [Candidatus Polarisedimenticolaceae bacterium]